MQYDAQNIRECIYINQLTSRITTFQAQLGLGQVKTRLEIWLTVPVFLETWTEQGHFLEYLR